MLNDEVRLICDEFEKSGVELLRVVEELIGNDESKMEMIKHIIPRVEKLLMWHDGMWALINSETYDHQTFGPEVLRDMESQTRETFAIIADIKATLSPLIKPDISKLN